MPTPSLRCYLMALAVAAAGWPRAASARPNLDAERLARLSRYDVLTFGDPGGDGIDKSKAIGVFDATPEEVFRTATDYERLAEFAPRVVSSQVMDRRADGHTMVLLASDLPWPVSRAWAHCEFQAEKLGGEVYRVRFWQVRGSLRRYFGSILIEPWSGSAAVAATTTSVGNASLGDPLPRRAEDAAATKSAVTYEFLAEPNSYAPKGILNKKLRDAASHYVHALRQRVNELHRLGRLHPAQPPMPDLPSVLAGTRTPVVVERIADRSRN